MRFFKWGPLEITSGDEDEGGVSVVTFKQALITTVVVAAVAGAIWLFALTQPSNAFINGFVGAYWLMPLMIIVFAWLCAGLSWLLRGFRKQG